MGVVRGAWCVVQGGTVIVLETLRRYTKTGSLVQMFDVLAAQADSMGLIAMPIVRPRPRLPRMLTKLVACVQSLHCIHCRA